MNWMKSTDWEKLPNGFMWRRDPSTMKFIGLRSAGGGKDSRAGGVAARKTVTGPSGTLTMTSTTFATAGESFGTNEKTSGSLEMVRGSLRTIQKTSGTFERAGVSLGTFETTPKLFGRSSMTIGTVPTAVKPSKRAKGPSVSINGTPRMLTRVDVPFETSKGTLGSFAAAHETLGTAKATLGAIRTSGSTEGMSVTMGTTAGATQTMGTTAGTIGTTSGTMGTTARAIGSIRASGTTVGLMHTPIIQHIITLCGFGTDSVFVEYINKEEWTKSFHATSMSFSDVDEIHTVEKNGYTFKARPSDKELKMFKAFLMFHTRMSRRWNRSLDENDVMKLITESTFHCYLCSAYHQEDIAASRSFDIPFFDELVAAGVFHIESTPPSVNPTSVTTAVVPPSSEDNDDDDITTLEASSYHEESNDTLFVESWNDAVDDPEEVGTMYDKEEEVVTFDLLTVECDNSTFVDSLDIGSVDGKERKAMFKGKDNAIDPLTASRCFGTIGKALKVKPSMIDQLRNRWGADGKETNVISLGQWGVEDAYPGNKSGEENVVVFIQRMLIAVMDRRQVFDPGGGSLRMESKLNLVQQ